ncbi:unnamed protein product [Allacma fusca]|uniref:Uncharacterized protein n=1 Tax=Allacma fusca TaxID=39272 RepID=A0A8J2JIT1_9HEXA|nr:unnamed protein product [Allacma fusca]
MTDNRSRRSSGSRTNEFRRREDDRPEVDRDDDDRPRYWTQFVTQKDIEPPQAKLLPNADTGRLETVHRMDGRIPNRIIIRGRDGNTTITHSILLGALRNGRDLSINYSLYKREPHYCGSIGFPEYQRDIEDGNKAPEDLVYLFKGQRFDPTPIRRKPPNCRLRNRQPGDPWLVKPFKSEKDAVNEQIPRGDYLRDPWAYSEALLKERDSTTRNSERRRVTDNQDFRTTKVHIPNVTHNVANPARKTGTSGTGGGSQAG